MFKLQVVSDDGTVLRFHAGEKVELDLRAAIRDAILAKGVGLFRNQAHVKQDIEDGIEEALEKFKATALPWRVQ